MQQLFDIYDKFLSFFPDPWHPWVSIAIIIFMISLVFRFWKIGVLGIILLVLFVPSSIPVLRNIGLTIWAFLHR